MKIVPQNKAELLTSIDQAWTMLEETIRSLDTDRMTIPGLEGWSIKDHLAHITTWERILLIAHLQSHSFAEAANMDESTSKATEQMTAEQGLNDFFYQRDKETSLAMVLENFRETHQQLRAELAKIDFMDNHLVQVIMGDTYEHYTLHNGFIQALI